MSTDPVSQSHLHTTDALDALLADYDRRLKALEAPIVVPPPVVTPPGGAPAWWVPQTIVRSVQLPPSVDATGATDVTSAIKTFISGLPDGTRVLGAGPTATYKHAGSLWPAMKGKNHLDFDWLGATTNNTAVGPSGTAVDRAYAMSTFWVSWTDKPFPTHLSIRNVLTKGANPVPGTLNANEYAAAVHAMGVTYLELDNVSSVGTYGDHLTLNENAQFIWAHGSKTTDVGRNNLSVVCASHVLLEGFAFGQSGYCVYDLEPEPGSIANIDDIVIRRGTDKGFWTQSKAQSWLAVDGVDSGKKVTRLVVDSVTSTKPLAMTIGGVTGKARPSGVSITGNAGAAGGYIKGQHVDGWVSRGNMSGTTVISPQLTDCPNPVLA